MENQTITPRALGKMLVDGTYLLVPVSAYEVPIQMSEMADGLGGFHSCKTLNDMMSPKWTATFLTINELDYFIVRYSFCENGDEQASFRGFVEGLGLVNCLKGKQVEELDLSTFVGNEYAVMGKYDKHVFDALLGEYDGLASS